MPIRNMKNRYKEILKQLECKASLKQSIYRSTAEVFSDTKVILSKLAEKLHVDFGTKDPSVEIAYKENNQFEIQLKFASDVLVLSMHSNVFNFDTAHNIHNEAYVKNDPTRSYCGVIFLHNFLTDSIKYNRLADMGTLIARIFINKEKHFFVEGEGQLSFLYNNFSKDTISDDALTDIIEQAILYCIEDDLLLPPYAQVKTITLDQKNSMLSNSGYPTGKPLGYQFNAELEQNKAQIDMLPQKNKETK